ncbi:hypothetical protein H9P43_006107 [Blastocladiella emersonii ATCC 22665]|nr:hypothetical protein H9P43_006107 [Blastocladiella emersonii ATCC 22665]
MGSPMRATSSCTTTRMYRRLDALLFQCGDLRDVAYTFDEAKRKYGNGSDQTFVLSDTHPEVLARNLLVLHAVSVHMPAEKAVLARRVGQLYYSTMFEPATHQFWLEEMRLCLDADWIREDAHIRVLDDDTLRAVRHCWQSWLACDWTPEKLTAERNAYLGPNWVQLASDRFLDEARTVHGPEFPTGAHGEILERHIRALLLDGVYLFDPATNGKFSSTRTKLVVNPTMLLTGANQALSFSAPYTVTPLDVFEIELLDVHGGLYRSLIKFTDQLSEAFGPGTERRNAPKYLTFATSWKKDPVPAAFTRRIAFIVGHPIKVMEKLASRAQLTHPRNPKPESFHGFQPEQSLLRFSVIETRNWMDSCGLLNLLLHASPLLGLEYDFVLSDTHPEVIARNLLVLHAIAHADVNAVSVTKLLREVGQLFYSSMLDPATHAFWITQMRACLDFDWTREDAQVRQAAAAVEELEQLSLDEGSVAAAECEAYEDDDNRIVEMDEE